MNEDFYREYAEIEDTHWWFRGRREILRRVLAGFVGRPGPRILDIGFGTGARLTLLAEYGEVVGMDRSPEAIRFARGRCRQAMMVGDILQIPLRSGSVDLVTAFDVIEHVDDDAAALGELARVCRSGGHLLVTVPAFQFLWGNQDAVSHHRRRYTRSQLEAGVVRAGFRIRTLTYFNTLLFPVIAAVRGARRLVGPPSESAQSDFTMTKTGRLNDLLAKVFGAEGRLVTRWRLPVGVSLLCLAERSAT
jgi:ubiquinone/menaquinone biosynthesis C-methylase UbiE